MGLHRRFRISTKAFLALVGIMFAISTFAPAASASVFVVMDEWGKGYACNLGVGLAGYPLCAFNPATHRATFKRLGSGFTTDPNTGFTKVLTYNLAGFPSLLQTPVITSEKSGDELLDGDLATFFGSKIYFYSHQSFPATGSCATGLPNHATGCDGAADVPTLPVVVGPAVADEVGVPGNNEFIYSIGGVEFDFQSDELPSFAPPPSNPYRDIIGINGGGQNVRLLVGPGLNPFMATPEPPSLWLTLGAGGLLAARAARLRWLMRIHARH